MVPFQLLCRVLHRQVNGSPVPLCQAVLASMIRGHFYAPCQPISTSCLTRARLDEDVFPTKGFMKDTRGNSIFSAGSAKQRAARNKEDQPSFNQEESPTIAASIPIPSEPLGSVAWQQLKDAANLTRNFETYVMEQLVSVGGAINVAKSLLSYVAEKEGDLSYRLLSMYAVLCVHHNDTREVCDIYDILKMKFPTLDTGAYSLFIKGLSRSERWRESLDILEDLKKVTPASARNYSDCIVAAAKHRDMQLALKLYDEMVLKNLQPPEDAIQSLFNTPQDLQDDAYRQRLIARLGYFRENLIYPGEALMKSIRSWFESIPNETWRGQITKVTNDGHCQACKRQLESVHLTAEEYGTLKNAVIDSIIKGQDTFRKTTPLELQSFLEFVEHRPPYDIVIDGLNVAYIYRKEVLSKTLLDVVSGLVAMRKRILVLGRKHMLIPSKNWVKQDVQRIQRSADCFFLDNVSLDDPFLLYACLNSGSQCCFVTSDLLRDHKACLPDAETKRLFFKWQRGHQLVLPYHKNGIMQLQPILNIDTVLQSTATSWHIPYDPSDVERASFEVPKTWLCLKKGQ